MFAVSGGDFWLVCCVWCAHSVGVAYRLVEKARKQWRQNQVSGNHQFVAHTHRKSFQHNSIDHPIHNGAASQRTKPRILGYLFHLCHCSGNVMCCWVLLPWKVWQIFRPALYWYGWRWLDTWRSIVPFLGRRIWSCLLVLWGQNVFHGDDNAVDMLQVWKVFSECSHVYHYPLCNGVRVSERVWERPTPSSAIMHCSNISQFNPFYPRPSSCESWWDPMRISRSVV